MFQTFVMTKDIMLITQVLERNLGSKLVLQHTLSAALRLNRWLCDLHKGRRSPRKSAEEDPVAHYCCALDSTVLTVRSIVQWRTLVQVQDSDQIQAAAWFPSKMIIKNKE
ncbi:hypothetical protein DsansV1_C04g0037181 [Dioscorea sansibarensis]